MKDLGIILYDGPSLLDGEQVNGLTVSNSYSICGDCKHIHFKSCYVNLAHGPSQVFKAFHRNRYVSVDLINLKEFDNRSVRFGAYGDPAAVPIEIWKNIARTAKGYTGYTHQWENCDPEFKNYVMASVDTEKEYIKAVMMEWRTFRVRLNQDKMDNEFMCPASNEAGNHSNCEKCSTCSGLNGNSKCNITINAHGGTGPMERSIALEKGLKKMKNKKKWRREFIEI